MDRTHFSEKINLDELYERKNEVEQNRIKIYQKILSRVHNKIKITSRQHISEQFCFFLIPEFLVGTPRYDSASCTAYIMDKLIDNGFHIKYTHPNLLFISWQHYIDKKNRLLFKKQYGYAINGFGESVKEKKEEKKMNAKNANSLILKKLPTSIKPSEKDKDKNYKLISTYKPTGHLIYNTSLLKTISDGVEKNT
jgi:hypothetical protein